MRRQKEAANGTGMYEKSNTLSASRNDDEEDDDDDDRSIHQGLCGSFAPRAS